MPAEPAGSHTATATILFTDLVDSTAQRTRLGEERAEALRRTHDRLLADAIAAHRGTVAKHVGDGIMATFPGAADAVAAAVAIQQAIEGHNRRATPEPLAVRVGVSLGDITWENGDCYGTPVIEAARLCAAAEGGQILVAELVRLTARGRGGHTFAPVGQLALKGLAEPVAACAVGWEPLTPVGIPLPPRLTTTPTVAMVGRTVEQSVLARAWARVKDGGCHVVLLSGEPGIGKTRLATEAARAAHADGAIVLFGSCDEDVGLPYRPFVEALRHYVAHAPDDVLAAHVRTHKGELVRLVPELGERVTDLPKPQVAEAETERYLLFEACVGLLAGASKQEPVVLILDDLHWAGTPELLLVKHLVRSPMALRVLVIGTYRDTDLTRTHPFTPVLADLRREANVERLALRGLDDAAVVALVTAAAGHELTSAGVALAHAIHDETEGSPFFISEILRNLVESGAVFQKDGQWRFEGDVAALGIPEGVKEVIGRRLARLSEATNKVLGLAAVIGRQFDVGLLARIADASEDGILDALDEAIAAALVAEVPGSPDHFTFSHALIRTTLYEELNSARRARLHRRVGEALEALTRGTPGARINELAHHWLNATQAADAGKAVTYARQAGDQAFAGLAFEEAAAHYGRALAVLEPHERDTEVLRCDLLLALGSARRGAGNAAYRDALVPAADLARRLGDAQRLGLAAIGMSRPGGFTANANVVDEKLLALYEEASAALGTHDSILRARVLASLAGELLYASQHERRHALAREAVAIARRVGDAAGLGEVIAAQLVTTNHPSTLAERSQLSAELEALATTLGSPEVRFHAAVHRAGTLLEAGDGAGVERCVAKLEECAAELRQPFYAWWAKIARAMLAIMRGAPDAELLALRACEIGMAGGQPDASMAFGAQLSSIRSQQGRYAESTDGVRAAVEASPHIISWRTALAMLYCETDRVAEGRAEFDRIAGDGFDVPLDWSWTAGIYNLAETCDWLRDERAAAVLYPRLRPVAHQVGTLADILICYGSLGFSAGLLAACLRRWDDATRHFEEALVTNEGLGARVWNVRTRRAYASMLLERNAPGDAARARELIAAGLAEAEAIGMALEKRRLQELAERLGTGT
ncbi:MAG: ATP-binding protein [Candidatus Binatia bacterium]